MRDFKIFASIADIHIGRQSISAADIKMQLKKNFIKVLKSMIYLDAIIILGDIMHTAVSMNSDYAEVFYWFIDQIYRIARKKDSTIIIIKGTPSHDCSQLNNIKHYQDNDDGVDFRVYETIEEITLWDDYKVLILPDVRVKKDSEIEKYLVGKNRYDMIFGHGTIDTLQFFVQESENLSAKSYTYDPDVLMKICKGPIQFGHIHQYQNLRDRFYYAGPFTVLERGGYSAGFLITGIYNKDRSKYKVAYYPNPDSAQYYDFELTRKILAEYTIDEIIEAIELGIKDTKSNDLISIHITRNDTREDADKVLLLEEHFRRDRRISIVKKVKSAKTEEREKENNARKEKYAYVMDQNMELAPMMWKYFEEEIKPTMSEEQLRKVDFSEDTFRAILDGKYLFQNPSDK